MRSIFASLARHHLLGHYSDGVHSFGEVIDGGMEVVDRLFAGYGEGEPHMQRNIRRHGEAYLSSAYPLLSVIVSARVVPVEPMAHDLESTSLTETPDITTADDQDVLAASMRLVSAGTCDEYENCATVDTIEKCAIARYAPCWSPSRDQLFHWRCNADK